MHRLHEDEDLYVEDNEIGGNCPPVLANLITDAFRSRWLAVLTLSWMIIVATSGSIGEAEGCRDLRLIDNPSCSFITDNTNNISVITVNQLHSDNMDTIKMREGLALATTLFISLGNSQHHNALWMLIGYAPFFWLFSMQIQDLPFCSLDHTIDGVYSNICVDSQMNPFVPYDACSEAALSQCMSDVFRIRLVEDAVFNSVIMSIMCLMIIPMIVVIGCEITRILGWRATRTRRVVLCSQTVNSTMWNHLDTIFSYAFARDGVRGNKDIPNLRLAVHFPVRILIASIISYLFCTIIFLQALLIATTSSNKIFESMWDMAYTMTQQLYDTFLAALIVGYITTLLMNLIMLCAFRSDVNYRVHELSTIAYTPTYVVQHHPSDDANMSAMKKVVELSSARVTWWTLPFLIGSWIASALFTFATSFAVSLVVLSVFFVDIVRDFLWSNAQWFYEEWGASILSAMIIVVLYRIISTWCIYRSCHAVCDIEPGKRRIKRPRCLMWCDLYGLLLSGVTGPFVIVRRVCLAVPTAMCRPDINMGRLDWVHTQYRSTVELESMRVYYSLNQNDNNRNMESSIELPSLNTTIQV